ncbi:MAG: LEA type 2 family protein [Desulfobacterales bacterium]
MHPFRLTKITITTVMFLLTVCGCSGVGQRLEPPRVKLATIRVQEFNVLETVFEVQLRVFNTNDTALQIRGLECELEINGQPFAIGVSDADVEIPSYGTQLLPLRIYASIFDIIKSTADLPNQEQLRYHIKGKLRLGAGAFPGVLPFESEGNISLPDMTELKKNRP